MTTEQLPDGLRLAGIDGPFNACMYRDDCRAERDQRLTLQHRAADQAQRIADLEAKCDTLKRLHDSVADERDALRSANADLHSQVAYWHRKAVETRNEGSEIERQLSGQLDVASNELRLVMVERDALRARLAEIESQDPASYRNDYPIREQDLGREIEKARADEKLLGVGFLVNGWHVPAQLVSSFRLVPAQAVPDGWQLVPKKLTKEMRSALVQAAREYMLEYGGNSPEVMYEAAVSAAPEHKA